MRVKNVSMCMDPETTRKIRELSFATGRTHSDLFHQAIDILYSRLVSPDVRAALSTLAKVRSGPPPAVPGPKKRRSA